MSVSTIEVPANVSAAREDLAKARARVTELKGQLSKDEKQLARARERGDKAAVQKLEAQIKKLRSALAAAEAAVAAGVSELDDLAYPEEPAGPAIASLSASIPATLLPVRLETRWVKGASGPELWIRIFPDQIHQDTHELELTDSELTWGQHFWEQRWRAGGERDTQAEAWRQLAGRFGPARAAWVARALRPENPEDEPSAPVDPDQELDPPPSFPSPGTRAGPWTRAAAARQLPDRFFAIGYKGTGRVCASWGEPVKPDLATGPVPGGTTVQVDGLTIDEDLRWLVDFDAACKVGMGIRMPLPAAARAGLDRLVVLGARASQDPADGSSALGGLLEAHRYTDGFALLRQGTPTNNGATARSGLAPPHDPPAPEAYLSADPSAWAPQPGSDGGRLATALGIEPAALADVDGAELAEHEIAGLMLRAVWPATGDHYLRQLLKDMLSDSQLDAVEAHVLDHVRAAGALPVIRVGSQPYGVLPVGSIDTWVAGSSGASSAAVHVLRACKDAWLAASGKVPRAGATASPSNDLFGVLSMDGLAQSYSARHFVGPNYLDAIAHSYGAPQIAQLRQNAVSEFHSTAAPWHGSGPGPRLSLGIYSTHSTLLQVPLVDRDPPAENRSIPAPGDYIGWLLRHHWRDIVAERELPSGPRAADWGGNSDQPHYPLLFYLLRVAVLTEASRAVHGQLVAAGTSQKGERLEHELIDFAGTHTPTPARVLATPKAGKAMGDAVWPATGASPQRIKLLARALRDLERLPSAWLDRAARGALDICSHRLDAWISSLASQRLELMRSRAPAAMHVGAYGWLENLAPRGGALAELPSTKPQTPQDSAGWMHAPSLQQAATAALLRSGERSHAGQGSGKLLTVDLSSRRVRQAQWILDGVRAGNSLGELLGYRFERSLHESSDVALPGLIPAFRELCPARAGKLMPAGGGRDAGGPVVDGLALLRRWQSRGMNGVPGAGTAREAGVTAALQALANLADAVSDAVTAESVHHAAQGNPLRGGASLEALDRGEAPPPELEFIRSPQSGVAVSHRIGLLRAAEVKPTAGAQGWPADADLPRRAAAEPVLSAVTAALLPDPERVRFAARYDGEVTRDFTLADMAIGPLDVLYGAVPGGAPAASELEQRARELAGREQAADSEVELIFSRGSGWSDDDVSLLELMDLAATLRRALAGARPLDARDLAQAGAQPDPGVRTALLTERAQEARNELEQRATALGTAATGGDDGAVAQALLRLSDFGLQETILAVHDPDKLRAQAERVETAALDRVSAADSELSADDPAAALKAVFGPSFIVLPPFAADSGETPDLRSTASLTGGDDSAPERFLDVAAEVRAGVAEWQDALLLADSLRERADRGTPHTYTVAQAPRDTSGSERWAALERDPGAAFPGGRTTWVLDYDGADPTGLMAGLLLDEWVEVVPQLEQTTGIAIGYDAPGSEPPQAILLAVPPDDRAKWSVEALERVVVEALELAKIRAVDVDTLQKLGHFAPALFLAYNANGDTISTDLVPATLPDPPR